MKKLRVFQWEKEEGEETTYWKIRRETTEGIERSIARVRLDTNSGEIYIREIKGKSLRPWEAMQLLLLNDTAREMCKKYLETDRKYPFAITKREGKSGCIDYKLFHFDGIEENVPERYYGGQLHISMIGKLNEGVVDMHIGDFLEIMSEHFPEAIVDFIEEIYKQKEDNYFEDEDTSICPQYEIVYELKQKLSRPATMPAEVE